MQLINKKTKNCWFFITTLAQDVVLQSHILIGYFDDLTAISNSQQCTTSTSLVKPLEKIPTPIMGEGKGNREQGHYDKAHYREVGEKRQLGKMVRSWRRKTSLNST